MDRTDTGLAVLTLTGEHDLSTAPELRSNLDRLIADGGAIVVDLSPATFIDSSILGVILDARTRASEAGISFELAHEDGADTVGRVLEITGLRDELPVHGTREGAEAGAVGERGKPAG